MLPAFEIALRGAKQAVANSKGRLLSRKRLLRQVMDSLLQEAQGRSVPYSEQAGFLERGFDSSIARHGIRSRADAAFVLASVLRDIGRTGVRATSMLGTNLAAALSRAGQLREAIVALRVFYAGKVKGPTQVVHETLVEHLAHHGMADEAWEMVTRDMAAYSTHVATRHTVRLLILAATQGNSAKVAGMLLGEIEPTRAEPTVSWTSGSSGDVVDSRHWLGEVEGRMVEQVRRIARELPQEELAGLWEVYHNE